MEGILSAPCIAVRAANADWSCWWTFQYTSNFSNCSHLNKFLMMFLFSSKLQFILIRPYSKNNDN